MCAVTGQTPLGPLVATIPGVWALLRQYNMTCPVCLGLESETVEVAALRHDLDPLELILALNRLVAAAAREPGPS